MEGWPSASRPASSKPRRTTSTWPTTSSLKLRAEGPQATTCSRPCANKLQFLFVTRTKSHSPGYWYLPDGANKARFRNVGDTNADIGEKRQRSPKSFRFGAFQRFRFRL